jgi:hypothetical protein
VKQRSAKGKNNEGEVRLYSLYTPVSGPCAKYLGAREHCDDESFEVRNQ